MKNFVGIDLGTTNSAICSFDGQQTRIWKSPEQNDVTPSALYFDKRGHEYVGQRAYDAAPQKKNNAARLFKRIMGTKTPVWIDALGKELTPVECSAEILKTLWGYLPEEIRQANDTGTVITVPAAFNQMQKEATREAAKLAGLGQVALMQEPVAAIMRIMQQKSGNGTFLVYDLGGGTLDISIAESINSKVNLLAHGGIEYCGGRDFDRAIFSNLVQPWLQDHFALPDDFVAQKRYERLKPMAEWALEKAKIELSAQEEAHITMSEDELRVEDENGEEIYLDIPFNRNTLDSIIGQKIEESLPAVREVMGKANLQADDFENIVFIGGPTNYKPLRDKVSYELGIPGVSDVNPMTAVAEGAAIYAESIDWTTADRQRKATRGSVPVLGEGVSFNYEARTAKSKAKIAAVIATGTNVPIGATFQVNSDNGNWPEVPCPLQHGQIVDVELFHDGDNRFTIVVFDTAGTQIRQEELVITKTAATIDAIPASHSLGIEVQESLDGKRTTMDWLVRAGDRLPKEGKSTYKARQSIKAGSMEKLNFNVWEGEIENEPRRNRLVGTISIVGTDLEEGAVIPNGAELVCTYKMLDSGNLNIDIIVPAIGASFHSGRNFYSRQEGAEDFSSDAKIQETIEAAQSLDERIGALPPGIEDEELDAARDKVEDALAMQYEDTIDAERSQEASERLREAEQLLDRVRRRNLRLVRQAEYESMEHSYATSVQQYATADIAQKIARIQRQAKNAIARRDHSFEGYMDEWNKLSSMILFQQDWFVIDNFRYWTKGPVAPEAEAKRCELQQRGLECIENNDTKRLRQILFEIWDLPRPAGQAASPADYVNIMRG